MSSTCNEHSQAVSTERVFADGSANPVHGTVVLKPVKTVWIAGMTAVALIAGPLTFTWPAFAVFVLLTAVTICGGHSVGMHRLLIHRSFKTVRWIEKLLVYLGVLVGMAGPFGMIRLHDFRDWGQRQPDCHDFFAHRAGFWKDAYWQLCCGINLKQEPRFVIEDDIAHDAFYRVVEKTWMAQQLVIAVPLFLLGGLPFVVWGICCRVSVSLIGHWLVGYYAHQPKEQLLYVKGACVQGYNLPHFGLVTFGEAFHENHHAFPKSAQLGFLPGQTDLGWWLVRGLERLGLAWEVNTPETLEARSGLTLNEAYAVTPAATKAWLSDLQKAQAECLTQRSSPT
ncbi:acyl-CoA desaturase [Roseibium sp. MMSF_3544]|uniref:acyl-CoA desaturase n=1 Tax=unclassified Roseibium TaxID=2629323 RepID=UPI00273E9A56|nr:acyl-CoA desaturase [Roseibium sp. MMSF_3544]